VALSEGQSRLERIHDTGVVRVGFDPEALPFSFFNAAGDLVGFDVEMAHRLALELDVAIEFVPFHLDTLPDQLEEDHFDVAMGGVVATFNLLETAVIAFSGIEVTGAVVDKQHKVVSCPAYMLGPWVADVYRGIDELIGEVLALA